MTHKPGCTCTATHEGPCQDSRAEMPASLKMTATEAWMIEKDKMATQTPRGWEETSTMKAGDVQQDELVVPVNIVKILINEAVEEERRRIAARVRNGEECEIKENI